MLQFLLHSPTLGTRLASRLARFLCGTEAMVHMAKILATVSQMISVLAYSRLTEACIFLYVL